jgi:hypothetical protein
MILFEKNSTQLEYHPVENILEVRWIGILQTSEFEQIWAKVVELANNHGVENILLDATYVETAQRPAIYEPQVQHYFRQKLAIPTLKKIARVSAGINPYDQDILSLYLSLQDHNHAHFEFQNFKHHYEAIHWLTEPSF